MRFSRGLFLAIGLLACLLPSMALSAAFDGSARVEIADTTGNLSWVSGNNALTVECWFRISIPSGQSISSNMTILVDRRTGNETNPYAYLLFFNISTGNIEFQTRDGSKTDNSVVLNRPYLDRWYHVAVRRSGTTLSVLLDGREVIQSILTVGNGVSNTDGVSIGGWGNGKYFWGDIQEVRIWQGVRNDAQVRDNMFRDLSPQSLPSLRGYFKLGYSSNPAEYYRNVAANPPSGSDPGVKQGSGAIIFEEVDQAGEQSLFDSRKNKGEEAIVPLSGAFTTQQAVFARPTPGIPFVLNIGYSSANAFSGAMLGGKNLLDDVVLGQGWRHSLLSKLVFKDVSSERHLVNWDGAIETWVRADGVWSTRHKEYRGELVQLPNDDFEWITPDRLRYRFKDPSYHLEVMQGRLYEIEDSNGNKVTIEHDEDSGRVSRVLDTVNGQYDFAYSPQGLLTNVAFMGWNVRFEYNADNLLSARVLTGPASYTNINTRWEYTYNANKVLHRIKDPRGNFSTEVTYDTYGRRSTGKDALARTTTFEYDKPARRQMRTTDPGGKQWVDTFDRKGRPVTRRDPLGNTTEVVYDARGNVISRTDPLGWRTTFAYDERSNLIAETNALGLVRRQVMHDHYNKPVETIDPAGWSTHFAYDAAGNLLTTSDGVGLISQFTYHSNGLRATSEDGNGHVTSYTYTPDGFLFSKTDPAANTWRYASNERGWVLSATNPLDQVTTFTYNLNGQQVAVTDPLRTFTKTYDDNGNLLTETDAKGAITRYAYDTANQRTQMVDRASHAWSYTYTTRGSLWTTRDPLGGTVTRTYDDANRLSRVQDPLGSTENREYDANGNVVASIDKLGRRSTKVYDRLNRVIAESDPLGNTRTVTYDVAGRVRTVTSPNGATSENEYDGRGRLVRWLDPMGFDWHYAYDGTANITNITDALDGRYVMEYGPRGERTLERNQDGFEWQYVYDELMRLQRQTDPNGTVRDVVYDVGGRVETVFFSTGRTDTYQYSNPSANPTAIQRIHPPTITSSQFAYDSMDRVIQTIGPFPANNTVNYSYDAAGRLATITYPDGKVLTHTYDLMGRLTRQTDWADRQVNYTYDKMNRLATRSYPNGIVQTNSYDNVGRLTRLAHETAPGNALIALDYAYDRNGNKVSHYEKGTLDWTIPPPIDEHVALTAAGRLLTRTDDLNPGNDYAYTYDDSGNLLSAVRPTQSYALTYDEDNRALSVAWSSNGVIRTIQNRYDALGRRVAKTDNGVATRYVLDLVGGSRGAGGVIERVLCDMTAANVITAWYVHGPDLCYKVDTANNLTVYLSDAQANVIALADGDKNLIARYAYTPYGRLLGVEGIQTDPYRFVGGQGVMQDLPDFYFMRARYYSAAEGVFLSVDPVRNVGPTWVNAAYMYAGANPMSNMDPDGLFFGRIVSAVRSAVSTVSRAVSSVVSAAQTVASVARAVITSSVSTSSPITSSVVRSDPHARTSVNQTSSNNGNLADSQTRSEPKFDFSDLQSGVGSLAQGYNDMRDIPQSLMGSSHAGNFGAYMLDKMNPMPSIPGNWHDIGESAAVYGVGKGVVALGGSLGMGTAVVALGYGLKYAGEQIWEGSKDVWSDIQSRPSTPGLSRGDPVRPLRDWYWSNLNW
ncbi:MAG: LamG-like jellyroll fold domain-containing protein [Kiritimatiellia bacterium]|nr:LamG-like jellyroll fold domain-containing protein [Kiritimatiellia bacterium]